MGLDLVTQRAIDRIIKRELALRFLGARYVFHPARVLRRPAGEPAIRKLVEARHA